MSDGIDIDRVHYTAAMSLTTAEIVEAWHQHCARVLEARAELEPLKPSERHVLTLIAKGFAGGEIAKLADKSEKWVETQSRTLRAKLGMSTFEAVTLAIRAEWV